MTTPECIAEAFRAGRLDQARLEIAAYCGAREAREALKLLGITLTLPEYLDDGQFKERLVAGDFHLPDWAEVLAEKADDSTCLRAAHAAALATVDREVGDEGASVHGILRDVAQYILTPTDETRGTLAAHKEGFDDEDWEGEGLGDHGKRCVRALLECALGRKDSCIEAIDACGFSDGYDSDDDADQDVEARQVVVQALVPWLLGTGDPVKDRARAAELS